MLIYDDDIFYQVAGTSIFLGKGHKGDFGVYDRHKHITLESFHCDCVGHVCKMIERLGYSKEYVKKRIFYIKRTCELVWDNADWSFGKCYDCDCLGDDSKEYTFKDYDSFENLIEEEGCCIGQIGLSVDNPMDMDVKYQTIPSDYLKFINVSDFGFISNFDQFYYDILKGLEKDLFNFKEVTDYDFKFESYKNGKVLFTLKVYGRPFSEKLGLKIEHIIGLPLVNWNNIELMFKKEYAHS